MHFRIDIGKGLKISERYNRNNNNWNRDSNLTVHLSFCFWHEPIHIENNSQIKSDNIKRFFSSKNGNVGRQLIKSVPASGHSLQLNSTVFATRLKSSRFITQNSN